MTRPSFTSQISLGNVLQIIGMLAVVIAAFITLRADSQQQRKILEDHEGRLRLVENSATRQDEKLETVARDVSDIKIEQRATNALLRQLISNTTGQRPSLP